MSFDAKFILLFVENPLKSGQFYADLLQFEPLEQSPTFVLFALPHGMKLGLWSRYTAEPHVTASPGATELCFYTPTVDAVYEDLGKKGITVVQKVVDMDFGRTCVFRDLDGHRIRFFTPFDKQ
jgi:catechol 2,3-dioxygenase-like lactoylglutathione lyase family enzyme